VRVHTAQATAETRLGKVWLESQSGDRWKTQPSLAPSTAASTVLLNEQILQVQAAENAQPTAPYFTRQSIEQPYYDLTQPEWRGRSFALIRWRRGRSSASRACPSGWARWCRRCNESLGGRVL